MRSDRGEAPRCLFSHVTTLLNSMTYHINFSKERLSHNQQLSQLRMASRFREIKAMENRIYHCESREKL